MNGKRRAPLFSRSGGEALDIGGKQDALAASAALRKAIEGGASGAVDNLLDEEFTFIDTSGEVGAGRDSLSASALAADSAERTVRDYGRVALITSREPASGPGQRVVVEAWVRRADAWRLLVLHLNTIAAPGSPSTHPTHTARPADAPPPECPNPCDFVPYEAKSQDERDIIKSFQTLENAVIRNDAEEWVKHMADEFVVYRTKQHPTTRAERADALRRQKAINAEIFVAAVEAMRLWVLGDAAVMRADHVMPGNRRPPYRATRVWVKRDGRWQMAISQQTTRAAAA
jgi:hypothetical protein